MVNSINDYNLLKRINEELPPEQARIVLAKLQSMYEAQQTNIPTLHPAQKIIRDSTARFKVIRCGRRFGKTELAADWAIGEAKTIPLNSSKKKKRIWWLSPTYSVGKIGFRKIQRLAGTKGMRVNKSEKTVSFRDAGEIQVKTADDPDNLRGESLEGIVIDETAFVPNLEELWIDVLLPSLADTGGKAMFISTPKGRNYFHQLCEFEKTLPGWESFHFSTYDNPFIPREEIENLRLMMPARKFAQEIMAEFIDSSEVFENIELLSTIKHIDGVWVEGSEFIGRSRLDHEYYAGIDWGRSNDFTVISIFDSISREQVFIDRFTNIEFDEQLYRIRKILEHWKPLQTSVEVNNVGQPLFETMKKWDVPTSWYGHTTTNANKCLMVDSLVLAMENKSISLLDHPIQKNELSIFEETTTPTGMKRYSHPPGAHDDTVDALLLSYGPAMYPTQFSGGGEASAYYIGYVSRRR